MTTYRVRVSRWAEGWELDVVGVGVTQSARLTNAERMVRSYLRLDGRRDADTAELAFDYVGELGSEVDEVRTLRAEAAEAVESAADATRGLAERLVDDGLSASEVAVLLGVTRQRVSQLLAEPRGHRVRA